LEIINYFKIGMMSKGLVEETCVLSEINYKFSDKPIFARPTQSLLQKWLREKHKIFITIETILKDYKLIHCYDIILVSDSIETINNVKRFNRYEDALEAGLVEGLKLIY